MYEVLGSVAGCCSMNGLDRFDLRNAAHSCETEANTCAIPIVNRYTSLTRTYSLHCLSSQAASFISAIIRSNLLKNFARSL